MRPARAARPLGVVTALAGCLALSLAGCSGNDPAARPASVSPGRPVDAGSGTTVAADPVAPVDSTDSAAAAPAGVRVVDLEDGAVGVAAVAGEPWFALVDAGAVLTGDGTRVAVGTAPLRLVATPAGVWVSVISDGRVVRIDPATGKVDLRVRLRPATSEPEGLAYDGTTLWVVDQAGDRLVAVDPATGRVGRSVDVGGAPRLVTNGPSALWVANYEGGSVTRVVVAEDRVTTRTANVPHCLTPQGLAEAGGIVWIACTVDGHVVGLDARTLRPVVTLRGLDGADAVVAEGSTVYAVGQRGPTVWRIDARTHQVTGRVTLDDTLGTSENVGAALVGDDLVVTHPDVRREYVVSPAAFGD